jgi:hypothetical protein
MSEFTKEDLNFLRDSIEKIQDKLDQSKVLNGGFDTMIYKIDNMQEKQNITSEKVEKIHEALYEPDEGFFARVKTIEHASNVFSSKLEEHQSADIQLFSDIKNSIKTSEEVSRFNNEVKKVAGERLENLEAAIKTNKMFDKLFWLMLTGVGATIAKFIWDLYVRVH